MSFYDFFRNIFGPGGVQKPPSYGFEDQWQHRDEFRNPIWQTDDDDDDDDDDDFRHPGRRNSGAGHFNIYSDPFEITRYFENQMESMLKNLFGFSNDSTISPFGEGSNYRFHHSIPIEPPKRGNLRDEVLKPGYQTPEMLDHLSQEKEKVDADLDGRISSNELSKVWRDPSSLQSTDSYTDTPQRSPFVFHSFGQSISTKIIRKPDGSVEQHRTVRDSEGNEETTVTHQIGDKTHTVFIKKEKNGEKTENEIVNSGNHLAGSSRMPFLARIDEPQDDRNPLNYFPWHKFFGPNPKL